MSTLPARGSRRLAPLALLASLVALSPRLAPAAPEVVAVRGTPSSLSARYGAAVPVGTSFPGYYVIPSTAGCEIRLASQASGDSLVSTFRSAGVFTEVVAAGSVFYLMAGTRGIVAIDLTDPAAPAALGLFGGVPSAQHGAYSAASRVLAAGADSTVHFLREGAAGDLALLQTRGYSDGRRVMRIAARGDSFLVAAERPGPIPRLILSLFRVGPAAAPESLWEFQANGHEALDLSWQGNTAFLADGGAGILPFHLPTRTLRPATPLSGNRFASALDADSASVFAVGQGRLFAAFTRAGSLGDSLIGETDALLTLEPSRVSLVSGHAIIATDSELQPSEPDDVARSAIEDRDLLLAVTSPPIGGTGRVRRVLQSGGYAYLADYTGGLRIYRAGGPDSSLVGVLPGQPPARTYDLALDPAQNLLYLASGSAGVEVVDVSDPASPQRIGSFTPPGLARCVALLSPSLLAVGWSSGPATGGIVLLDITTPSAPGQRGSASSGPGAVIQDPRALAARDTILFVADALSGVISVGFGNPDAPAVVGVASGVLGTVDVSVQGTTLLAATQLRGVQVVDVSVPGIPILRSEVALPPVYGVAQQGSAAIAFLGPDGAAALDLTDPGRPAVRGPIPVPGQARDGSWTGDTLLVASSYSLERFQVSPVPVSVAPLFITYDDASGLPRSIIRWSAVSTAGAAGLNLYRDRLDAAAGTPVASGVLINSALMAPTATDVTDSLIQPGSTYRYRLEVFFPDGSSRKVAEGSILIPSVSSLGRPYPNPFRPALGSALFIPFRTQTASPGAAVTLRVFDPRGHLVRTLVLPAAPLGGFGAAAWDGKDDRGVPVASGRYFIHVRGPGIDDSKSAVLVR